MGFALVVGHGDGVWVVENGRALDMGHFVLAEQRANPFDQPVRSIPTALEGHAVINLEIVVAKAQLFGAILHSVYDFRIFEQRFGGDAPNV